MSGMSVFTWKWVIPIACFWTNFCILGISRTFGVIFVALIDTFGLTREQATWPSGVFTCFVSIASPFAGFLSHYVSIRLLVFCGCVLASSGVFLCYFATDVIFFVIFYGIFQGVGVGLVVTLTHVIVNQHFKQRRAVAMGISYAGSSIGSMVLPSVTEFLIDFYGLHGSFLILGGIMLQSTIAALFYRVPDDHENDVRRTPCSYTKGVAILSRPMFVVICLSFCLYFTNISIYLTTVVDFAKDVSIPEDKAVFLISAFSAGDLTGRLGFGWVSDHKRVNRKAAVMLCQCVMGVALLLNSFTSSFYILTLISVVLGLMGGSILINYSVLMTDYMGLSDLPLALGFANFIIGISAFLRPLLIGHFRDVIGQYNNLFVSLGCAQAIIALSWMMEPLFRKSTNSNNPSTYK